MNTYDRRHKRVALLYAALCGVTLLPPLCSPPAVTAQAAEEEQVTIKDARKEYRVGFLRLESESISTELEYLQRSLPELFVQEFSRIENHFYDESELQAYRRYLLQQATDTRQQELNTLLAKRDQYLFPTNSSDDDTQPESEAEQIVKLNRELEELRVYDTSTIVITQDKPIEIVNLTDQYASGRPSHYRIAEQQNIDLFFTGSLQQDNEFILLSMRYYYRSERKIMELPSISVAQDEIALLAELMLDRIADLIIGRPWASIIVTGAREQDQIYLGDRLIGYGPQTANYIPLGEYTVRIESDYTEKPLIRQVTLSTAELPVMLEVERETQEPQYIDIETVPTGATVYVNSTWHGETPLTIERAPFERSLLIRKPGYFDVKRILNDDTEEQPTYTLTPELFDQGRWLLSRRDRFYASLAALVISVPIPIILNGIYENNLAYQSTADYSALNNTAQNRVDSITTVAQVGGIMGILVSVALTMNTIIDAVRYVNAADFFHRL